MVHDERDAQGAASVAGGWLNPNILEGAFSQNAAVADTVERNAAGQAQVGHPGLVMNVTRHPQHDLLGHRLDGRGKVHLTLGDLRFQRPGGAPEQPIEPAIGHRQAMEVVEILHVELE